jgi:hypothetical protein
MMEDGRRKADIALGVNSATASTVSLTCPLLVAGYVEQWGTGEVFGRETSAGAPHTPHIRSQLPICVPFC